MSKFIKFTLDEDKSSHCLVSVENISHIIERGSTGTLFLKDGHSIEIWNISSQLLRLETGELYKEKDTEKRFILTHRFGRK